MKIQGSECARIILLLKKIFGKYFKEFPKFAYIFMYVFINDIKNIFTN